MQDRIKRDATVVKLASLTKSHLKKGKNLPPSEREKAFTSITDLLLDLSKCPDYIVNRGHYFGTSMLDPKEGEPGLSDDDKRALIAFLKTF